jgi:phospholipase C
LTSVVATVLAVAATNGTGGTAFGASPVTANPIKHIVVIYEENHSFDSVLGDICVAYQRCDGSIAPVHLADGKTVTPSVGPTYVANIQHTIASQQEALANQWDTIQGCAGPGYLCITYYTPAQEPSLASLARRFVVADRTFQASDAPSWGARVEVTAGTTDGFTGDNPLWGSGYGWGCDTLRTAPYGPGGLMQEPSCIPDNALTVPNGGAWRPTPVKFVPTIMDRLHDAGKYWKIYAPTNTTTLGGYLWNMCPTFAECLDTDQSKNVYLTQTLLTDAKAGNLPAWSMVVPTISISQHNGSSITNGDDWIGQAVSAIEQGPDWSSTAIFITWDDCGCFYDHVTPPKGDGIRAPMVIISPYARSGYTDSTPTTVAGGLLAFTEHTFGLPPLSTVDANAYDFRNSFNFAQKPLKPSALPYRPPVLAAPPSAEADDPT